MKTIQTGVKFVIEYRSLYNDRKKNLGDQRWELDNLKSELRQRGYLAGFDYGYEESFIFQCETCEYEHENRDLIGYKCSVCKRELCDMCCYADENEKMLCDDCYDIRDAAESALDDIKNSS